VNNDDTPAPVDTSSGRYSISNGVVTDNVTKFQWQQADFNDATWSGAKRLCEQLNLNGSGWRVPNIDELFTLLVDKKEGGSWWIDPTAFPNTSSDWEYWSSTPYYGYHGNPEASALTFVRSNTHVMQGARLRVRCVR
jgi:hypothetical protein